MIPEPLTALLAHTDGPPLTKTQEISLAKRVERGDLAAKDQLITANIRLVVSIAALAADTVLLLRDVCNEPTSLDCTVGDSDTMTLGTLIAA
jgi:DNA-directed RNA polymerase sigma subunit (sigma70/sigma32)